jgi:hypothetical protein
MNRSVVVIAVAALFGCGPDTYPYAPVRTTSGDIAMEDAAVRAIPPERPRGEVRVAALGVVALRPGSIEDSTLRALHVEIVVSNRSEETWRLDGAEQRVALGASKALVAPTTARVERPPEVEIPARSTRAVDLFFPLPASVRRDRDLPAFVVLWTVRTGSRVVADRAAFQRLRAVSAPRVAPPTESAPSRVSPAGERDDQRW